LSFSDEYEKRGNEVPAKRFFSYVNMFALLYVSITCRNFRPTPAEILDPIS
jgi:hypothetical protein